MKRLIILALTIILFSAPLLAEEVVCLMDGTVVEPTSSQE